MLKERKFNRLTLSILVVGILVLALTINAFAESTQIQGKVLQGFLDPSYENKPMARMWFGDATAGIDDNDVIEKQIKELVDKGFGGVEVACLIEASSSYTNDQAYYAGWGTESWKKVLKKIYETANSIPGGFIVDLTISAHWPPVYNVIDFNDNAASQQIGATITKIASDDLTKGYLQLEIPPRYNPDISAGFFPWGEKETGTPAHKQFVLNHRLTSTSIAQVISVDEDGNVTLDFNTIKNINNSEIMYATEEEAKLHVSDVDDPAYSYRLIDEKYYMGFPAGIPDEETVEYFNKTYGRDWNYEKVKKFWGEEPNNDADLSKSYNGKQTAYKVDENGMTDSSSWLRARMADWQKMYSADLNGLSLSNLNNDETIAPGDWVVVSTFTCGTEQVVSAVPGMPNGVVCMNYFDEDGVDVIDYVWENYIVDDEIKALMRANGGSIFEDSIEASTSTKFWTENIMEFLAEYKGKDYAHFEQFPVVIAAEGLASINIYDETGMYERIVEDYNSLMGDLYIDKHVNKCIEFAHKYGYTYRAQPYDLVGLDIAEASAHVDIVEGDNMTKGDGLRVLSAANSLQGKNILSMEAFTGAPQYGYNWETLMMESAANYSWGVTRVIMHGTPYSKSINGYNGDWPGWNPFLNMFGEAYTYRQLYWDDFALITNYMTRNQAIMQTGIKKVDLAVLRNRDKSFTNASGNMLQGLLDEGYSYNILSEALLELENCKYDKDTGQIFPEGVGYKALIMVGVEQISQKAMQKIYDMAKEGLPIVCYSYTTTKGGSGGFGFGEGESETIVRECNPKVVYGTSSPENSDDKVAEIFTAMKKLPNVKAIEGIDNEEALVSAVKEIITPYAQYKVPALEATHLIDESDGTSYYYLFNNTHDFSGMITGNGFRKFKVNPIQNVHVTLQGIGIPFILDAFTGEIYETPQWKDNGDGTITLFIDELGGCESMIVAIVSEEDASQFGKVGVYVTDVKAPEGAKYTIIRDGSNLIFRSGDAGEYIVTISDGSTRIIKVESKDDIDLSNNIWNLKLNSASPEYPNASNMVDKLGIQTVDPSEHKFTSVDLGNQPLGYWYDEVPGKDGEESTVSGVLVNLSRETLAEFNDTGNVRNAGDLSGIAIYSTTFEYTGGGAVLHLSYNNDQITSVIINGRTMNFNSTTDQLDLTNYLKKGSNDLEIELTTCLARRASVENSLNLIFGFSMFGEGGTTRNGLESATVKIYTDVLL